MIRDSSNIIYKIAILLSLVEFTACGTSVQHARRGPPVAGRDPDLVAVRTTGLDAPYRVVSFAVLDEERDATLSATAPKAAITAMRAAAAREGAEFLLLSSFESLWRRGWLGLGVRRAADADLQPQACAMTGLSQALARATVLAERCARAVAERRPALRGAVEVVFLVDPWGRVLEAAPTPDSSRDSELQHCALDAAFGLSLRPPEPLTCQGRLSFSLPKVAP